MIRSARRRSLPLAACGALLLWLGLPAPVAAQDTGVVSGTVVRQISVAFVQRGLNRQPSGKFVIAGTTPAISVSRVRPSAARLPSRGSESTRPCV